MTVVVETFRDVRATALARSSIRSSTSARPFARSFIGEQPVAAFPFSPFSRRPLTRITRDRRSTRPRGHCATITRRNISTDATAILRGYRHTRQIRVPITGRFCHSAIAGIPDSLFLSFSRRLARDYLSGSEVKRRRWGRRDDDDVEEFHCPRSPSFSRSRKTKGPD